MEVKKVLSILETPLFSVKMPPHLMLNLMGKAIRPSILAKYEQSESIFRNKQFYKNANLDGVWVSAMEAKNWPVIHALLENYPEGLDIHDAIALNNYVVVNAMARFTMESILDHAIIVGDITMVAMLFEHPQYSEKWAHTGVVQYAAGRGHVKVLKYLIEEFGMRCDNSVMDAAAANGHLNTVKLLFKTGHGCTSEAYRAAAAGGHEKTLIFLLNKQVDGFFLDSIVDSFNNGQLDCLTILCEYIIGTGFPIENVIAELITFQDENPKLIKHICKEFLYPNYNTIQHLLDFAIQWQRISIAEMFVKKNMIRSCTLINFISLMNNQHWDLYNKIKNSNIELLE